VSERFDYIVVGAGSAGCVVAARLSENPSCRVLLIEAGGSNDGLSVRMPAGARSFHNGPNPHNWFDFTEPQQHLQDRTMYWPSGKGLGGTSAINGMAYVRGHRNDYDGWAQLGLRGWSYDEVLPYFIRAENNQRGASAYHGGDGPLRVSDVADPSLMSRTFVDAGVAAGYPANPDFNGAEQDGFGYLQSTLHAGVRCSTASAYLRPALRRANLHVVRNAVATRLLSQDTRITGVEWRRGDQVETALADGEVVLSAGVTRTPQLLMLSGIGDAEALQALGIPVVADRPEVGRNLQDHVSIRLSWTCPLPVTLYAHLKWYKTLWAGIQYLLMKRGPAAGIGVEANGFVRSRPDLANPDLQIAFMNALLEGTGIQGLQIVRHGFSLNAWHLRPEARGQITLRSNDPFEPPVIDPRYLDSPVERAALIESVRIIREIVAQPPFDRYRGEEISPGPAVRSAEDIEAFVHANATGLFHPVGSARMGADPASVVDERLAVRGVSGLRVADASIMPRIVSGNTNAAVIMIGEKAADLIAASRAS
jgi:choline dehydrogenase